jgi:hypothetical protein
MQRRRGSNLEELGRRIVPVGRLHPDICQFLAQLLDLPSPRLLFVKQEIQKTHRALAPPSDNANHEVYGTCR